MDYNFTEIEARWRKRWADEKVYEVKTNASKPKYYVLSMFPYPSGAGLHVGHPLGYIAADIYARYKRNCGYNVLQPMGYDAYGLPAEQYAIQTGQHPAITTEQNIRRYREQLDLIGFSFDWSREVRTCDPAYYKWTQWAFQKMFSSFYCNRCGKAQPIEILQERLSQKGTIGLDVAQGEPLEITAEEWNAMTEKQQQEVLMNYRLAYLGETMVNWCAGLGTVLANDEVVDGLSVRGGFPVEQRKMKQWCLRISAYSQRLLDGLNTIDWSDSIKETQRNWIGRSEGAEMQFKVKGSEEAFTIFTTRADTIFGVTFMVLAPESEMVQKLTTTEQKASVEAYLEEVKHRTELDRMAGKKVTGVFTGSYAINPFTGDEIPVWVSDYVLAGYGTGAIMAVPAHDSRDYAFAKRFNLPIVPLVEGCDVSEESFDAKEGIVTNSPATGKQSLNGFSLNGLTVQEAIAATKHFVEENGLGRVKVNYRLRDAIFSRQRYWGEPFPVYYKDGMPYLIPETCLPLELPEVDKFLPTETGEPPLGNAKKWAWDTKSNTVVDNSLIDYISVFPLELSTMPGFAGSSAYYLRYMDARNDKALVSVEADNYWRDVDLYVGGSEHATGHLIYSRFWNKFLFDLGVSCMEEPFRKLVNQGMIQGRSNFVYRIKGMNTFVSFGLKEQYDVTPIHVDISLVGAGDVLNIEAFRAWRPEYAEAEFVLEDGKYICGWAVEKMSKSMFNVSNPDQVIARYGADTLRLYEMFLGPITQSKPWDQNGIDGCARFLRRAWNLFFDKEGRFVITDETPTKESLKSIHKLTKKVSEDMETMSYNTSIAAFMIAVGELANQKCHSKEVLERFVTLLSPFAPFVACELWQLMGHNDLVLDAPWPTWDEAYLKEDTVRMAVSFSGKTRYTIDVPTDASNDEVERMALGHEAAERYMAGKQLVKVIVVPKRIVNIVLK